MRNFESSQTRLLGGVAFGIALAGCNSFDPAPTPEDSGPRLVIPVDERSATSAAIAPKPVSGGTLTITADGKTAIASDPDRDLVWLVDLQSMGIRKTIDLDSGDEPGRSVVDADGHAHVALRGGGAVLSIDTASGEVLERQEVCRAPRGLAFEAATALVHVACADGKLVSLPAAGGAPVRTLSLDTDLRDVMVRGNELWVTRFKSAQVLRVSSTGELSTRLTIPNGTSTLFQPAAKSAGDFSGPIEKVVAQQAEVAWRAVPNASGGAIVVHQQAVLDEIEITEPSEQGSAYGGSGFGCGGIVGDVITSVGADGSVVSTPLAASPLPVDVAISPDQQWIAVAHAGPADLEAPRPFTVFPPVSDGDVAVPTSSAGGGFGPVSSVSIVAASNLGFSQPCIGGEGSVTTAPVTAVAFTPTGALVAQTREPAQLLVVTELPWGGPSATIPLPGASLLDTGHEVFHRDSGGGIACASCHPEGGEDGHVWRFAGTGERRTQALHVGLQGTAPFHWAGDLENVGALMSEVFVGRMGGVKQSEPRLAALEDWLFSMQPPPALREAGDEAAVRGKKLFESSEVGCASCHSGEKLTDNKTVAVDALGKTPLQVPSLVAVGYRAPFMHTGCAATLLDRFDPACGGDAHGNTASLTPDELGDLVAYLESL